MREPDPGVLREVPGGARRGDTFLLVVATVALVSGAVGFRHSRPPVIPLFFTAAWLHFVARWLCHVRPQQVSVVAFLRAVTLGAALYAAWVAR